jgi:hypothetical protein
MLKGLRKWLGAERENLLAIRTKILGAGIFSLDIVPGVTTTRYSCSLVLR